MGTCRDPATTRGRRLRRREAYNVRLRCNGRPLRSIVRPASTKRLRTARLHPEAGKEAVDTERRIGSAKVPTQTEPEWGFPFGNGAQASCASEVEERYFREVNLKLRMSLSSALTIGQKKLL